MSFRVPRRRSHCRQAGLSIVELLISLTIVAMLLTAVAAAFSASAQVIEQNDQFFRATQAARVSLNQILTEVRRSQAVTLPSGSEIDVITFDGSSRNYLYDANAQVINMVSGANYTLASSVTTCTFTDDTTTDKGGIVHVVRVSIEIVVQVGNNLVRLSGSAAPRNEIAYN